MVDTASSYKELPLRGFCSMDSSWKTCSEGKTKAEPAATNGKTLENFMASEGYGEVKQRGEKRDAGEGYSDA